LFAGGGGDDGEPDHALGGVLLLELLHVTAGIVFLNEGAFVVEPFENDEFAAKVGEFVGGALGVGKGEFRGILAGFGGGEGGEAEAKGEQRRKKDVFHDFKIS
jgi:hypothetical protein